LLNTECQSEFSAISIREDEVQCWDLRCSGLLRIVGWLVMDVSGQHIEPIVKGEDVEDFLSLEYGTDMLSRNVHYQPTYDA